MASIVTQIGGLGTEVMITSCLSTTTTPISMSSALLLLNGQYCLLSKVMGTPAKLNKAISNQPTALKDAVQLSGLNSSMSSITVNSTQWAAPVATVADSLNNLWMTVMDMRGAVQLMQDNCCKVTCDSIVIDFSVKLNDARTIASIYFAGRSKLPVGFSDCNTSGNVLTISDSLGNSYPSAPFHIANYTTYTNVAGVMTEPVLTIDLTSSSLNYNLDYTFNMDACMTNGTLTCQKCITKKVTYKDTCAYCEVTVTAGAILTGSLTIAYQEKSTTSA